MGIPADAVTVQTLLAIAGPIASVAGLGWWLSGRFRAVETATSVRIEELAKLSREQLQSHEERDQERHQENIDRFETMADRAHQRHDDNQRRFEALSVSLAKLGANGRS